MSSVCWTLYGFVLWIPNLEVSRVGAETIWSLARQEFCLELHLVGYPIFVECRLSHIWTDLYVSLGAFDSLY